MGKSDHLFKKGQVANPKGRPKGAEGKHTVELRDMVRQALDRAGGVDYLVRQSEENPSVFMSIVAKTLPQKLDLDVRMISTDMIALMQERRDAISQSAIVTIEHDDDE